MGRTQILATHVAELHRRLHEAEKCKEEILSQIRAIKEACLRKEISYSEYEDKLRSSIDGRSLPEWVEYYDNYIELCKRHISSHERKFKQKRIMFYSSFFIAIFLVSFFFNSQITGFLVEQLTESNYVEYSEKVEKVISSSSEFNWERQNEGQLLSFMISGKIAGEEGGKTEVYIDDIPVATFFLESQEISLARGLTGFFTEGGDSSSSASDAGSSDSSSSSSSDSSPSSDSSSSESSDSSDSSSETEASESSTETTDTTGIMDNSQQQAEESPSHTEPPSPAVADEIVPPTSDVESTSAENDSSSPIEEQPSEQGIEQGSSDSSSNSQQPAGQESPSQPQPVQPALANESEQQQSINESEPSEQESNESLLEINQTIPAEENLSITGSISRSFTLHCNEECDLSLRNITESSHRIRVVVDGASISLSEFIYRIANETSSYESESVELLSPIKVNEVVKWKKTIKLQERANALISLPEQASNVSVDEIVGNEKRRINVNERKARKLDVGSQDSAKRELLTTSQVQEIEVFYETPAPEVREEVLSSTSKEVVVYADDALNYTNVLTSSELPKEMEIGEIGSIRLYWIVNDSKQKVDFRPIDSDSDGLVESIEWTTPHLSEQFFQIIIITKAEHLTSNRSWIADIYDSVKELDDVWSPRIEDGELVRVVFEVPLDSSRDITIFPRAASGSPSVEIYEVDGTEKVAEFSSIVDNEYNKVFLSSLEGMQDTFDLRIVGGSVEFDHIIDPITAVFSDDFETDLTKWNGNGATAWDLTTAQEHGGAQSLQASNGNEGDVITDDIDASDATEINVSFWFRDDDLDSSDIDLYFFDGAAYDVQTENLEGLAEDTWHFVSFLLTDSQYFKSNFRVRFNAVLGSGETFWIDDFLVQKTTADAVAPQVDYGLLTESSGSEISRQNIVINVTASDDESLENITIYLFNSSLDLVNETTSNASPHLVNITNLPQGQYFFNATAHDASGNSNSTATYNVSINLGDILPPDVSINAPLNQTYYRVYDLPLILDVALSEEGYVNYSLDGGINNITMNTDNDITFTALNDSLDDGSYTFSVYAEDLFGNKNYTENVTFTLVTDNALINGTVVDADGMPVNSTVIIYDEVQEEVIYNSTNTTHQEFAAPLNSTYTIEVIPHGNEIISEIEFTDVNLSEVSGVENGSSISIIQVDELAGIQNFTDVFAINPVLQNFTNASVTFIARSTVLMKCPSWNFTAEVCQLEDWQPYMSNLVVGQEYSFELTPGDPGYGFIVITKARHLNETREFVSNIYDYVSVLDGIYSETIPDGHYVRVTFAQALQPHNDITVYPKAISGNPQIGVYVRNEETEIARFGLLEDDVANQIFLTNLTGSQDTFDLLVMGGDVQFDYIIDPIPIAGERRGILLFGNHTSQTPDYREWNGSNWSSTIYSTKSIGAIPEWITVKGGTTREEWIMISADNGDDINILVNRTLANGTSCWGNGTACGGPWEVNATSTTANVQKAAIAYEHISGDALAVWSDNSARPFFTTWNGSFWSRPLPINDTSVSNIGRLNISGANIETVKLIPRENNSNEIALLLTDSNDDAMAVIWNGTNFYCESPILSLSVGTTDVQKIDGAYEDLSGDLMVITPVSGTVVNATQKAVNACTWTSATRAEANAVWIDVAGQYGTNNILYAGSTGGTTDDMNADIWNSTAWGTASGEDTGIYASEAAPNQMFAAVWAGSANGIIAYSDAANTVVDWFHYNRTSGAWNAPATDYTPTPRAFSTTGENNIKGYSFIDENKSLVFFQDDNVTHRVLWAKIYNAAGGSTTSAWTGTENGLPLVTNVSSPEFAAFDFAWQMYTAGSVDSTPPFIRMTFPQNTTYNVDVTAMNYTFNDAEGIDECWYSTNGLVTNTSVACGTNVTGLSSSQGSNIWFIAANDTSNNLNYTNITFFKDTVIPSTIDFGIRTEQNNSNLSRANIVVNVTGTDANLANITIYLYNNVHSLVSSDSSSSSPNFANFTGLSNGVYYFNATINDTVNNRNNTGTYRINLDTVPPLPNIVFPQNTTYNVDVTAMNYTCNEFSYAWYSTNGGAANSSIVACGTNFTGIVSSQGSNNWILYMNDSAGNLNSTNATFFKDTVIPLIDYGLRTEANMSVLDRTNIVINVSVTDTNFANVTVSLYNWTMHLVNQTNSTSNPRFVNITGLQSGVYQFNATAYDTSLNSNSTGTYNVTISNIPPRVARIFSIADQSITENGVKPVIINFSVLDVDGHASLVDSSSRLNVSRGNEYRRNDTGCVKYQAAGNNANYSCIVNIQYFDSPGVWNISAYIEDQEAGAMNATANSNFTLLSTSAFVIGPSSITFPGITPGAVDITSNNDPIILNNTGNAHLFNIEVNATNLRGENNPDYALWAGNFSIAGASFGSPPEECRDIVSVNMSFAEFVEVPLSLLRGNHSINNGDTGQEEMYACLILTGSEISSQVYSTEEEGAWIVRVAMVGFALKRRRKKASKDRLMKAVKLLAGELHSKYSVTEKEMLEEIIGELAKERKIDQSAQKVPASVFGTELGALEALSVYLKDFGQFRIVEIARALGRSEKTIWASYSQAKRKRIHLTAEANSMEIPLSELVNSRLTVLECLVCYLKDRQNMRYSEIAKMLSRNQRNIWTIYSRAVAKKTMK